MVLPYIVGVSIYKRELNTGFSRLSHIYSVQHWQKLLPATADRLRVLSARVFAPTSYGCGSSTIN